MIRLPLLQLVCDLRKIFESVERLIDVVGFSGLMMTRYAGSACAMVESKRIESKRRRRVMAAS
jgi:hypothetical protein